MGKIGTDPDIGKATRFPHNDPTKGGRPVSIRAQLKDLLEAEGNVTMPASQVVKINDDGSVILKLPTQMQMAMKLSSWAMSKKGNDSLKAIQMIMEQIDGKPVQPNENRVEVLHYSKEERDKRLKELLDERGNLD